MARVPSGFRPFDQKIKNIIITVVYGGVTCLFEMMSHLMIRWVFSNLLIPKFNNLYKPWLRGVLHLLHPNSEIK